jgi:hypothetical protein
VREVVRGYRGKEKPRFASRGFSSPLCSATSGACILKTQVFKKTCKTFCKKKSRRNILQKGICAKKQKHRFESKKTLLKRTAKPFAKKKSRRNILQKGIYAKKQKHRFESKKNAFKKNRKTFCKKNPQKHSAKKEFVQKKIVALPRKEEKKFPCKDYSLMLFLRTSFTTQEGI